MIRPSMHARLDPQPHLEYRAGSGEAWRLEALCAQTDPEQWFPDQGGHNSITKQLCAECPVQAPCLEFALANNVRFGTWGGLTERERRPLHKARREAQERGAA